MQLYLLHVFYNQAIFSTSKCCRQPSINVQHAADNYFLYYIVSFILIASYKTALCVEFWACSCRKQAGPHYTRTKA